MADRNAWVEALSGVVAFTDELNRRTNSEIASGFSRESELHKVTFLIGSRGRRLLKAIQVLVPHEWDDIVGNLARSLVEATLDLDYLHTETTIEKDGTSRILTPDVKASLFTTHLVMFEWRASGELRSDHEKWFQDAVALREACAVRQGPYWHGRNMTGPSGLIEELLEGAKEDEARTARLKELHSWFGITSFFEHNTPNMNFYFGKGVGGKPQVLETCTHPGLIEVAAMAGAEICWTWGWLLGLDEPERNAWLKPVERARKQGAP